MSYLTRLSDRVYGQSRSIPSVMPKGLKNSQPAGIIARMEETEEQDETLATRRTITARTIKRQEKQEEPEAQRQPDKESEEEVALLRRQEAEEEEELSALRRQETTEEEEQIAPLRRQETEEGEDEPLAPMRPQETAEEEEKIATLRRQIEEEEEEVQPLRPIARQEEVPLEDTGQIAQPPTQTSLEPGAEPVSQELAGEEEPSGLQALHRDVLSNLTQSPQQSEAQGEVTEHRPVANSQLEAFTPSHPLVPDFPEGDAISNASPQSSIGQDGTRSNVIIEQVDIMIHEPAIPAAQSVSRRDHNRALRARYLHRL